VARKAERRGAYRVSMGKPEENRPLRRTIVDGRILLKRIFKNGVGRNGLD
jgi:hypothetical protein